MEIDDDYQAADAMDDGSNPYFSHGRSLKLTGSMIPTDPWLNVELKDSIDAKMGFSRYSTGPSRLGWLVNMQETLVDSPTSEEEALSAVDFYFIQEDGRAFKATLAESPYFLIACKSRTEPDVEEYLRRKYEKTILGLVRMTKEDLDLNNHLLGAKRTYIKILFRNTEDLIEVKRSIMPLISGNKKTEKTENIYSALQKEYDSDDDDQPSKGFREAHEHILDIREYDIPYVARVAIDHDYRVGMWYTVLELNGVVEIKRQFDRVLPADPVVFAFDIETTKLPLKFPDASSDQIMMISYMIDRQGYLITNREIVSTDIDDFDYSPKPGEFDGPFMVFNEEDERAVLVRFFEHICNVRPSVFVTYNGDFFDWPFIETRAKMYGIDMYQEIGWYKNGAGDYCSAYASHMDCFRWVKRDSYLPVGSQGLKAVTKCKLGYDPKELDPELMTPYASSRPHILADYSVSDAVATYYLYMKYVHPFIFSLCNIIPLHPDDVLRKGSGTLCEMLLMVEAFKANVIMPNKHRNERGKFFNGHYLESETYVGGHVEALESGVFRSDISTSFNIDPTMIQQLIDDVDRALKFSIEVEESKQMEDITNYDEVKQSIVSMLTDLRDHPRRSAKPLIYHLDVAAMYPNIILTNRLQPPALVSEETCALCDFNTPESNCQRKMTWSWRGEYFPADRSEYNMIRNQLEQENFPSKYPDGEPRKWTELTNADQANALEKRLSDYSRKVYRRIHETKVQEKESIVCQRENSFYVDTVRNFRDRRYEYKGMLKDWKKKLDIAQGSNDSMSVEEAKKMVVLMDSLQLAHKCILNSFYGYVMRKGSRWYSMEMAGIVCLTGAKIIQMARQVVEKIGRPLELDTDGIWCILPKGFPETFKFQLSSGKSMNISYPCVMLNHLVHAEFTNDQYQVLVDPDTLKYEVKSENSIFFEVDGPYRAMILPASKEENKLLKKRYAVFNDDGSLAELKGFEVKRRGELKLIKIFQEEVFQVFLKGNNLEECYQAVASVADRFLDIIFTKGKSIDDEELLEYISENRSMSKKLEEYGKQKSTSISTAKRLAELLGNKMVQDKGLACHFIIASQPAGATVTERAIPVAVFSVEPALKSHFLRKWLKNSSLTDFDIRSILDWDYYKERFGSTIQKLITIPAAMQSIKNPVSRLPHPDWLIRRVNSAATDVRQPKITEMFAKKKDMAIEDILVAEQNCGDDMSMSDSDNVEPCFPLVEESPPAIVPKIPSAYEDYPGWLVYQQKKWRQQLKDRRGGNTSRIVKPKGGVAGFLQNQNRSIMSCYWEIIQIAETETPGLYKVWALVGNALHSFKFSFDRIFYVNCRLKNEEEEDRLVGKLLPRTLQSFYLYQFVESELEYQKKADDFRNFGWHHDSLGMFESHMPLDYRGLLSIGCISTTNRKTTVRKSADSLFTVDDLIQAPDAAQAYLSGKRFHFAFVYHSQTDGRHVFGLFMLASAKCNIIIIGPPGVKAMPNISRMYKEGIAKDSRLSETDAIALNFEYPADMEAEVSFVSNEKSAFKMMQKILSDFQNTRPGPTCLLLQSPRPLSYFSHQARIFLEFPAISIAANKRDNSYPALDWQRYAAQRMLRSLFYARDTYVDKLMLARYSQIPISSFDDDPAIFIADLTLSRLLARRNIVSWYSTTGRPDLGGREEDDNVYVAESLADPEINLPSLYNCVCLEFNISDLATNAILQSTFINEMDGSDGNAGLSNADMKGIDELIKKDEDEALDCNAPSYRAFKSLKDAVRGWAKDHLMNSNPVARVLLKNTFRWICNPKSRLYDPSILAYVHGLMTKLLMQLLGEFKRLGSKIVYATFHKIIVQTTKTTLANARAYQKFILDTIRGQEAFAFIDIQLSRLWENLLWMDSCNFAGMGVTAKQRIEDEDQEADNPPATFNTAEAPQVLMEWGICEFYPPYVQTIMLSLIQEFLTKMHQVNMDITDASDENLDRNQDVSMTATKLRKVERARKVIREHFTRQLLEIVPKLRNAMNGGIGNLDFDPDSIKFPNLPGSHRKMDDAVLELISMISHLFSLYTEIQEEVRVMRRQLLQLIGVKEFSQEAEFKTPCESFIVHNVVCAYCQHCRDVDLAFDYQLKKQNEKNEKKQSNMTLMGHDDAWRCTKCLHEYDINALEEMLVHLVHQSLMAYQIQDMVCKKCKMVKRENIRSNCKQCAEAYVMTAENGGDGSVKNNSPLAVITEDNLSRKMRVLKNIASANNMKYLQEVVAWIH